LSKNNYFETLIWQGFHGFRVNFWV